VSGRALVLLLALAACREAAPDPGQSAPVATAATPRTTVIDRRDQYALAHDVVTALAQRPDDDPGALARVKKSWEDRRVRWEMAYIPALCSRKDRCFVAPFDHRRFEQRMVQGWLPRLDLDDAGFAALRDGCAAESRCVVRFEARVAELVLSHELPTAVTLDQTSVLGTRAAADAESWVVARR
jgi:hypothetical protein